MTKAMLRAFGLPLMCLAMFSIAGGHWAVLQTVAWAQMLRDYSKNAPLASAVEKTFSGKAPCELCKKVQEGRQKEEKSPAAFKADKKIEIFLCAASDLLPGLAVRDFSYALPGDENFAVRSNAPPGPVPRSLAS